MASFLRGKQVGIQNDLSEGITASAFAIDQIAKYGINSQISCFAYDPVQSLLAVGTKDSAFGKGQIYVFGQKRVSVIFSTPRHGSIEQMHICADKLIAHDLKNDLCIFSLESRKLITSYSPPGRIAALITDPTLDYALIGLQNGEIIAYDLDRLGLAPFRIPNLWREKNPRSRLVSVVSIAMHPRDIGTLLIGYSDGVVLYSFKQHKALSFFNYELPPGAPGGYSDPASANIAKSPRVTNVAWHPTGTFFLVGYDDSSFVVWDPKTSSIIIARTLQESHVNKPGKTSSSFGSTPGTFALKAPFFQITWCSKANPEDTGILIAGGAPTNVPDRGLTFLDLGPTPVYATSSWQILSDHFEKPKRQYTLSTPPGIDVASYCLIPRTSPHYDGANDPVAVIALLDSGEVVTLSFPSGHPITPTNQLHASLTFVHPFINKISLACIDRTRWLGMLEKRSKGPPILQGGAEATRPLKRFEKRDVLHTAHADGTIRIWDAGHGDEIENEDMLQIDVATALGGHGDTNITTMSMSGATGEAVVGMRSGEVVIFRWGRNPNYGGQEVKHVENISFGLDNIQDRGDPALKEGLLPLALLPSRGSPVSTVQISDVGFVAAGFEDGRLVVMDMRGPAVIFETKLQDFAKSTNRGSIRRHSSQGLQQSQKASWPTKLEFGVMDLDGEDYSSILLFAGSSAGHLLTFKVLPGANGAYSVQLAGTMSVDDRVISISAISGETGTPAYASQSAVAKLREGYRVNGALLVTTHTGARLFKPSAGKGAHKAWNDVFCDAAGLVRYEDRGYALLGLYGDGTARIHAIPTLKEIASTNISQYLDVRRLSEAIIGPNGDIFGWNGPSEITVINVWGTGLDLSRPEDRLYHPEALIPPRPTISNIQWISGTQYVTPSDLDILIGGPDRPPSKRMIDQMRSEEQQRRTAARSGPQRTDSGLSASSNEGYWAYMQRQITERTERLNIMGDSMDQLEESSSRWTDDVNKFVSSQKKKAVMGMIGSKFGF